MWAGLLLGRWATASGASCATVRSNAAGYGSPR